VVKALNSIDLDLGCGESVALVGESGCGKSVLGHGIMRLLDDVAVVEGRVEFDGKQLYDLAPEEVRKIVGAEISLVPQNPTGAFNPVVNIGAQFQEVLMDKKGFDRDGSKEATLRIIGAVGFEEPERIYRTFAHRMSGGMCERTLIGMAACVSPRLLIADEPTKGLDGSSKKKMIAALHSLKADAALIMITHDLGAAATCQRICVMYAGEIVEEGPADLLLSRPLHPYTKGLIAAQPENGLTPIPGMHRIEYNSMPGCRFRNRCSKATRECESHPDLHTVGRTSVRCHHA
jgi:peptide/nickel transport system ATP-binding protein